MDEHIDSRDVLDADHRTTADFAAWIVGHFQPLGADPWSDFTFVAADEGDITVLTGIEVQLEKQMPAIRMRWHGKVIRAAWAQGEIDAAARADFIAAHLTPMQATGGIGAAAVIARKLSDGHEPSMND